MDFPDKSFQYQLYKPSKKREVFLSYGSHDNIDIDNIAEKQFYPQKIPEGFLNKKISFKPCRPALPLHEKPQIVEYPLKDRVTDPVTDERKEIVSLIHNLKYNRGIVKVKPGNTLRKSANYKCFNGLKTRLEEFNIEEDNRDDIEINDFLPKQFHHLVHLYQKYKDITEIQKVNSFYADGCLGYMPSSSSGSAGCLIRPLGSFQEIKLSYLEYDDMECATVKNIGYIDTGEEIYGTTAGSTRGEGFIVSRHSTKCKMYRYEDDLNPPLVGELQLERFHPTSQCLSPYIPGECLTATNVGSVYLWSQERKEEILQRNNHRFSCREEWRQAIFSSHPRQVVSADCTKVEMFDLRKKPNDGMDLFALPSRFLHPNERIRIIKQHSPFMYVIATDYSLILVDERFPGHPLLQWQHLLRNPPQYLSILADIGKEKQILISIASQSPMETYCYMFQGGAHKTLQGIGSPWQLSRIDDFTKFDEICKTTDKISVEHKYKRDSLLGLQCVPFKDGFVAYQLDVYGDIYYQVFQPTNQNTDKTFAAGPGMNDLVLDEVTIKKGRKWIKGVNKAWDEWNDDETRFIPSSDVTSFFEEIVLEKPSHIMCQLCNGEINTNGPDDENMNGSKQCKGDNSDEFCHACRQYIRTGKLIADNATKDRVCSISSEELNSLPNVASLPTDVLSQMITRLWKEEHIDDLLPLRDEEVKRKLEKPKEKKKRPVNELNINGLPPALVEMMEDADDNNFMGDIETGGLMTAGDDSMDLFTDEDSQGDSEGLEKEDKSTTRRSEQETLEAARDTLKLGTINVLTKEKVMKDLSAQRRRHSSISSLSSIQSLGSTRSSSLPGFMRTLTRKYQSPVKKRTVRKAENDSDISSADLLDEEFLSQESRQTIQMFSNVQSSFLDLSERHIDSASKRVRIDSLPNSPNISQLTPSLSPQKKTRVKKKFVSGF
ncbi:uncharacterized protein LOC127735075 isoform X1 [Mytilus californianus]|uniref:uncharacterized protein LOC127735075 isoform X1 n=2 Tax=Mytilus californianus TaxID=6549 RepID=UPI002247E216|nr:uncharacterized protein LOC127735075 isoform X1 [Mytilus californianus]XP_052101127.1 uncharacterized protein LOC127735075 isoform X1 [Mytilus californianus]